MSDAPNLEEFFDQEQWSNWKQFLHCCIHESPLVQQGQLHIHAPASIVLNPVDYIEFMRLKAKYVP